MAILAIVLTRGGGSSATSNRVQAAGNAIELAQPSITKVGFSATGDTRATRQVQTDPSGNRTAEVDDLLNFEVAPSSSGLPQRSTSSMAANWLQYLALVGWFLLIPVGLAAIVLSITAGVATRTVAGPARDQFSSAAIRTGIGMALGAAALVVITLGSFAALL